MEWRGERGVPFREQAREKSGAHVFEEKKVVRLS